jgi:hypothetical protein
LYTGLGGLFENSVDGFLQHLYENFIKKSVSDLKEYGISGL